MAGKSPIDVRRLIDVTIGTSSSGRETNTITLGPQANRPVYVYSTITGMRMPAVYTVFKVYTEGFRVLLLNGTVIGCKSINLYPIV